MPKLWVMWISTVVWISVKFLCRSPFILKRWGMLFKWNTHLVNLFSEFWNSLFCGLATTLSLTIYIVFSFTHPLILLLFLACPVFTCYSFSFTRGNALFCVHKKYKHTCSSYLFVPQGYFLFSWLVSQTSKHCPQNNLGHLISTSTSYFHISCTGMCCGYLQWLAQSKMASFAK